MPLDVDDASPDRTTFEDRDSCDPGGDDPAAALPPTERRNPASLELDRLDTAAVLRLINDQDATVPGAVRAALPQLAELVEAGLRTLRAGGRVHYYGAGTGGRIALGDAVELGPTYGVGEEAFVAHLAGGPPSAAVAREGAEDEPPEPAERDAPVAGDLVIGVTASGGTPYVLGALRAARAAGATTALLSGHPQAPAAAFADLHVLLETGPEVVTGSTRMKAGTAQKLALNAFSTALMVRSGRTWSNLMVSASARNAKLRERAVRTLVAACRVTGEQAGAALDACGQETVTALVVLVGGCSPERARAALAANHGHPWAAVRGLRPGAER
ncbi:N-acetylmuramic acid 6-phosphate etherase [Kitasatospora sp. NBC_01287]|uniref:N-acetylmuramic acid 6-phosphate etherase n=1 Tax=Kitasatospora sp. NBC_01287 TaxID=2903573 RepID=UPI0022581236|nr:N-acetylmuramic acid 6-phosphate etherase [Kitasatospora sp. NBC_01287]MCX4748061.1 N-acetylmuramic acid 6-phosphate etherase [Kitasatospora sp. NBC_01287]